MIKLLDWLNQKAVAAKKYTVGSVSAVKMYAVSTATQINTAAHQIYKYSPTIFTFDNFNQFWQGYAVALNPEVVPAVVGGKKTQQVVAHSLYSNLIWCMGSALTYEAMKYVWRSNMPYMENSYPEFGLDCVAAWYFACLSLRMVIDNNSYNVCLPKTLEVEHPHPKPRPRCEDGIVPITRGNALSAVYYVSNLILVEILRCVLKEWAPLLEKPITLLLLIMAYGQCFAEYLLTNMCTDHRYKELAKNNLFAFGLGLAFLLWNYIPKLMLRWFAGFENPYVEKALFYLLFQYFMLATMLFDKDLPGKTLGKDIFFHGRLVTESLLKQYSELIAIKLQEPGNSVDWQSILEFLDNFQPLQITKQLLLYKDQQTFKRFLQSSSIQLFFNVHGDDIQNGLKWVIDVRQMEIAKRAIYVMNYIMPRILMPPPVVKGLRFVVRKKMDGVLEGVFRVIEEARINIRVHDKYRFPQLITSPKQQKPLLIEAAKPEQTHKEAPKNAELPKVDSPKVEAPKLEPVNPEPILGIIQNYQNNEEKKDEAKKEEDFDFVVLQPQPKGLSQNSIFSVTKNRTPSGKTATVVTRPSTYGH